MLKIFLDFFSFLLDAPFFLTPTVFVLFWTQTEELKAAALAAPL